MVPSLQDAGVVGDVRAVGFVLGECPAHGEVCALHLAEREGPGDLLEAYQCPGRRGDTGGCNEQDRPLGGSCTRPEWAEYPYFR